MNTCRVTWAIAVLLAGGGPADAVAAQATLRQPPRVCALSTREQVAKALAEASRRFGLPQPWLQAVMRVESAGRACATSHKGAMGLMQVMPATYSELRWRYGVGPDPYAVRDNILAGAAYLREMVDRFGPVGALAAYNAGPGRYREHLAGRPLPLETRAYVAKLAPSVNDRDVTGQPKDRSFPLPPMAQPKRVDPLLRALRSPLFSPTGVQADDDTDDTALPSTPSPINIDALAPSIPDSLFVAVSRAESQP